MGQLAEPALGGPGAVHLGRVEEGRSGRHAGVECALLLFATRGATTVGELGRGPAGASRRVAPGHCSDAHPRDENVGETQRRSVVLRPDSRCRHGLQHTLETDIDRRGQGREPTGSMPGDLRA